MSYYREEMLLDSKKIFIDGIDVQFFGRSDDPYFQTLENAAVGLSALVKVVDRLSDRSVALDVGANIGLSAVLLARRFEKVIAYEPSPSNVRFLRENLAANGITNVVVEPFAVSAEPATLRFHEAVFGAGSHVVSEEHLAANSIPVIEVPAVALDAQNLPPISFIKMDAEGHEPEVLAGARGLLASFRPMIYMEINVWCLCAFAGHSPGTLVKTLWERFEVSDSAGTVLHNPYVFLHDTIVRYGGVADVVLKPKIGAAMPSLRELTWPESARRSEPELDSAVLAAFLAKPREAIETI
jgi:FkbM family methyltransferase